LFVLDRLSDTHSSGDSYTQTGFNHTLTAPSSNNPFGNPPFPGWTSSNGPNWVGYLTTKYNASLLQTYNLAYGGATVDSALVKPWQPTVISLKGQVLDEFVPTYVPPGVRAASPPWTSSNSLFAVWIGINDVGNSYYEGVNATIPLNQKIFAVYRGLVDELYASGARNFVFLNVPPVDRSPLMLGQASTSQEMERLDLAAFNGLIEEMAGAMKDQYKEVNVWVYDTHTVFGEVLDNPAAYKQTAGYKNVTAYCEAYQK
jgi:phospholipase/lecithinase/hemolysin